MKQRPIIFNTEMVRAILDGRKTQTRRPFPLWQIAVKKNGVFGAVAQRDRRYGFGFDGASEDEVMAQFTAGLCPIAKVGDRLWVRETWRQFDSSSECGCSDSPCSCPLNNTFLYKASHCNSESKWKPSIHMPLNAARIILEVTSIKVEKAYDAAIQDYKAEGYPLSREQNGGEMDPFLWFRSLWSSIYGDRNQWVWVIEFKVISTNGGAA
jgi:hypothetical protein